MRKPRDYNIDYYFLRDNGIGVTLALEIIIAAYGKVRK